jgi:prolyl oligopeptidase
VICIFAASLAWAQNSETTLKCPPSTRLDFAKDTYGTTVVPDPYRWLENQENLETRAWIAAQQKCTEAALSNVRSRPQINKRLAEIYETDSYEVPAERGGRYFFLKRPEGQDLSLLVTAVNEEKAAFSFTFAGDRNTELHRGVYPLG